MKTRRPTIGTVVALTILSAQPAVAWAGTQVSGSYLSYKTDFTTRESARYAGPTGGQIRLCADQEGAVVGQGGSLAYIKRDNSGVPDTTNSSMTVEGGRPYTCTGYTSSSSNAKYYTRVQSSSDGGAAGYNGYARAERP